MGAGMGHVFGGLGVQELGTLELSKVLRDKEHDVIIAVTAA